MLRKTKTLKVYNRPLRTTGDAVAYWVLWRAPAKKGTYRFCVRATDGSGNHSASACASIKVR